MGAVVTSVNVGSAVSGQWAGRLRRTGIDKRPVRGPVAVHTLGVAGDHVVDTKFHGGVHQAVYAYAREDLDHWGEILGARLDAGFFGENLTTEGIEVNEAVLGEHWRVGSTLLAPSAVRIPCVVFKNWVGRHELDDSAWLKRFVAEGRPGPYLRVLEEGTIEAGDEIVVERRPDHGVTVRTMFRALTTEPALLPELLGVEGLAEKVYEAARARAT